MHASKGVEFPVVALAMSGIRWRHYALGTLLGLPLPIAAYCFFIESLARYLGLH